MRVAAASVGPKRISTVPAHRSAATPPCLVAANSTPGAGPAAI